VRSDDEEEVELPIEDSFDLHPFHPKEIRSVVEAYLESAVSAGFSEVRLIHGRGTGAQRAIVQSLLSGHPLVRAYTDAPPERGGWGATIVALVEHSGEPGI
jgi:dsDNA-specific endonuclease/ATPase MutS2